LSVASGGFGLSRFGKMGPDSDFGGLGGGNRAMRTDSPRWHEVSLSEFDHEREGLAHLRELLPDRAPFHAWSNFEFRDRTASGTRWTR
jgi:hypothetical protein